MFSRLFKHKEQVILERLLHDNHVQSPCIASFLPVNGVAERHVYIGEKQCRTIRFVLIEVVPDPFITDAVLSYERKQYQGVQLFIPIQFHGLLNRCRKVISSIVEIPDAPECSIVLIEDALLLNERADAGVYVPSKTKLAVVAIQKGHEHKPVKAVFQDNKGNKYTAKGVTPLVAYILVTIECMTLEQYIGRDNHRHSTVVTFGNIDINDVASNDPMEFIKLKTIFAGQVQVKTIETFDFVVAFSNNKTDHTVLLIPKEKLKDIHAKLTNFATNFGKAEFICNHFQGCSYDEVIASKLYTIDPKDNMICNFPVTTPSHVYNVYEKDPTSPPKNRPKISAQTTSIATPKCIDPHEDDAIIEDDFYEPLDGYILGRIKNVSDFPHMLQQESASEIKDVYYKKDAEITYKKQNDHANEDSDYMPMNGISNLRQSKDGDDIKESEYAAPLNPLHGLTADNDKTDDVESLKMVRPQTRDYYVNVDVLALKRNLFSDNDNLYDDTTSNVVQGTIDGDYVTGRVPYVERTDEQNDKVFDTGGIACSISRNRHSIHKKHGRPNKEHIKST
ncbi:uncharacterized protein LOC127863003 [Dreissena polymorpha]|uniref:CABIT domain-containing protein n=1 Tax=Dreissena polymorpha TaxID=45954 RepID=A0A9D3YE44_DREPO|nr:uncharacterized protein LOC127863003 [Dreissena polymorpha]KAH3696854.1 hypothetical protein DPMN_084334 [Dreissena polymorpha]